MGEMYFGAWSKSCQFNLVQHNRTREYVFRIVSVDFPYKIAFYHYKNIMLLVKYIDAWVQTQMVFIYRKKFNCAIKSMMPRLKLRNFKDCES
ncbi:hypothetical protein BpHYR1_021496 [Brachionus plicatilis]|uniref:Uncharacterized protein n=1 Tax=Brachionus plicatilis TaxID=10195 RepID=A0A3M7T2U0_BRAPC|nr:hypothetical protein BpHYR1_021496 [Brachionus plicatilis]